MSSPKSDIPSPRNTRAKAIKALGGRPPKLTAEQVMKVNEPRHRGAAPDSFAPSSK